MTRFHEIRRKYLSELLNKYPNHGNITLAKKAYKEHPEFFVSFEATRSAIRYLRGANGNENRRFLTTYKYVRQPIQPT